jgi:hypothetical protein
MSYLSELKARLIDIRDRGPVKTLRRGNTGVGYTLETLLELDENNSSGADFGDIELKTKRNKSSSSKITAFSQAPIWHSKPRAFIKRLGEWKKDKERFNLYSTAKFGEVNNLGLTLKIGDDPIYGETLYLHSEKTNETLGKWPLLVLVFRQEQKLSKMVLVTAKSEGRGMSEKFHYDEANFYSNPSPDTLRNLIKNGTLVVDVRAWFDPETGKCKDHGVAFRISKSKLHLMYSHQEKIL